MRKPSPYKQQLNKDKEPEFYEIQDYLLYLKGERFLSDNTVSSYANDLRDYLSYLKKYRNIYDIYDVEEKDIEAYLLVLKNNKLSTTSISRRLSAIKSFHKFLEMEQSGSGNPAKMIKGPKKERHLPNTLSYEEVVSIIESIDTTTTIGIRNRAILELMFSTGMRISEVTELKLKQLHISNSYVIVYGKGSKERFAPLGDSAVMWMRMYLERRNELAKRPNELVFLNFKGSHLSRNYLFRYIKEQALKVGITKEISPHTIRHSFATTLLKNGADLRMVQEMLGHENISTTEIYTHIENSELQDKYNTGHPMARKKK